MNIPTRYCTGYLGDIGMPPPYGPMDFAAWFEVYLGGQWHTFDARNNVPRIGRVLIANRIVEITPARTGRSMHRTLRSSPEDRVGRIPHNTQMPHGYFYVAPGIDGPAPTRPCS